MQLSENDLARFWVRVEKTEECWNWNGWKDSGGYGKLKVLVEGSHKQYKSHRISFFIHNNYLPIVVRHNCDNPGCVRPDHLLAGTQADNIRDKIERGRQHRGENSGRINKITEFQARAIFNDPRSQASIAREYNINKSTVSLLKSKKTWRHIH